MDAGFVASRTLGLLYEEEITRALSLYLHLLGALFLISFVYFSRDFFHHGCEANGVCRGPCWPCHGQATQANQADGHILSNHLYRRD
ncbi:hypothetical protein CI102_13727 [Trichoderma harzianum]|nr:hypothetical protein CI102_13727 [Trichoderma harzianum]